MPVKQNMPIWLVMWSQFFTLPAFANPAFSLICIKEARDGWLNWRGWVTQLKGIGDSTAADGWLNCRGYMTRLQGICDLTAGDMWLNCRGYVSNVTTVGDVWLNCKGCVLGNREHNKAQVSTDTWRSYSHGVDSVGHSFDVVEPLSFEVGVVENGGGQTSAVNRRIRVHRPDQDLDLKSG